MIGSSVVASLWHPHPAKTAIAALASPACKLDKSIVLIPARRTT